MCMCLRKATEGHSKYTPSAANSSMDRFRTGAAMDTRSYILDAISARGSTSPMTALTRPSVRLDQPNAFLYISGCVDSGQRDLSTG